MNQSNKRGMTLIEVVVSLALLAIVTMAFVGLFLNSTKMIASSNKQKEAELEMRELVDGKDNGSCISDANYTRTCEDATMTYTINGTVNSILGKNYIVIDKKTGISYEYFKAN